MSERHCIDLRHLGLEGAIGVYVVPGPEPALVDPGPTTTLPRLRQALSDLGIGAGDLRHILLTHVHLDHAGCSGHLVEAYPEATVHVHEDGATHMADPTRLVASTRRTFGEDHDRLWGETRPVPRDRLRPWAPGSSEDVAGLRPVPTPGHIAHHLAYLDEGDGTLYAGDSMGIVLSDDAPTHPPTPPPAVDLRAWEGTLAEIGAIGPERFGATHFGFHGDVESRRRQLGARLQALEARVRTALAQDDEDDAQRFEHEVREELVDHVGDERVHRYFDMFGVATDWEGVAFYLRRNP